MKPRIDIGNCSAINASNSNGAHNMSPMSSENESLDSSHIEVLAPLAKSDKLLKILARPEDECSFCSSDHKSEHLHFILSEQQVVDPYQLPGLEEIDTTCLMCGKKSLEPKLCSQCRNAVYCNQTCQSSDWPKHRAHCRADEDMSVRFNSLNVTSLNNSVSNSRQTPKVSVADSKGECQVDGTRSARTKTSTPVITELPVINHKTPEDLRASGDSKSVKNVPNEKRKEASPKKPEKSPQQKVVLASQKEISIQRDDVNSALKKPVVQTKLSPVQTANKEPSDSPPILSLETEVLVDGETGVSICFGRTPSDFYLQKSTAELSMNLFYDQITLKKDQFPQLADNEIKRGALCGGIYSADDQCYRARITEKIDDHTFGLYFVDYGNTEPVEKKDIKRLPALFFQCKAQAIHCSLNDVVPIGTEWSPEAIALFGQLGESNHFNKVKVYDNSKGLYKVDLLNENGESITKLFIDKGHAKPASNIQKPDLPESRALTPPKTNSEPMRLVATSPKVVLNKSSINEMANNKVAKMASLDDAVNAIKTSKPKVLKSYLEYLKSETTVTLVISSPFNAEEFIYLGSVVDEELGILINKLNDFYKSGKERASIVPSVDDIVVAKGSDGDFYRSYVVEVNQSVVKVLMFDSGYIEDINIADIHNLDDQFYRYPVFGLLFVPVSKISARLLDLASTEETLMKGDLLKQKDKLFFKYQNEMIALFDSQHMFDYVKTNHKQLAKSDDTSALNPFDALPLRQFELNKKIEALALYQEKTDPKVFYIAGNSNNFNCLMICSNSFFSS